MNINKMLKISKFSLGMIILVGFYPSFAFADDTGAILGAISNGVSTVNNFTTSTINGLQTNLTDSLRSLSGQETVNNNGQTTAMANIAGTQDTRQVILATEAAKLQAEEGATSGASDCNVTTGIVAGQSVPNLIATWREQLTQSSLEYENGDTTNSPSAPLSDSYQTLLARESNHCKNFATAYDVSIGLCPSGSSGTNTGTQKPIMTSINGSGLTGTSTTNPNNTTPIPATVGSDLNAGNIVDDTALSTYQTTAANQWMANMIDANPQGALPAGYAKTPANVNQIAQRETAMSRQSVVEAVLADIIADKKPLTSSSTTASGATPGPGNTAQFSTTLQGWAEGTALQVLGYQKSSAGTYFPNGISNQAQMELRAKSWFFNPTWQLKTDAQIISPPLLKDLNMMTAYNVYQNYMLYRQQQETNLLLSTIAATLADKVNK